MLDICRREEATGHRYRNEVRATTRLLYNSVTEGSHITLEQQGSITSSM